MTPARSSLKKLYIESIPRNITPYQFPALASIGRPAVELPNETFGKQNYYISKTKFGHWPVYLKIQNTKITTEIKKLQGDVHQFKADLLKAIPGLDEGHVTVNSHAGYVNVKGDLVQLIKQVFNEKIK
ncbi:54S ribosomal protein Img2p, mitochondrial [[Candida] anglica]|uniref:Large ribosomal subunit protein mL49 n=1 Tax=[Candida] anglica TaxID=148631 RepID=A0ABP0E5Q1_9ASCO